MLFMYYCNTQLNIYIMISQDKFHKMFYDYSVQLHSMEQTVINRDYTGSTRADLDSRIYLLKKMVNHMIALSVENDYEQYDN